MSPAKKKKGFDYYPWLEDDEDDSFAWIYDTPPELMETDFQLQEGEPCSSWFPKDLTFDLSPEHGSKLTDSIPNTDRHIIASEKLKELLEARVSPGSIEFLPVRLRNPKKKLVDKKYFVANVLKTVGCVDKEQSEFVMDAIDKGQVNYFTRLTLDEKKIPEDATLFRLGEKTDLVIIRSDLARVLLDAKCNGMMFIVMEEYGAEFREAE